MDNSSENSPKFVNKERILLDSKIEVKYPEKTWTIEQSYRDIYQNHLDAQFKKAVNELLEDLSTVCGANSKDVLGHNELRKVAYEYLATKNAIDSTLKDQMANYLIDEVEVVAGEKIENSNYLRDYIESHSVRLPKVEILVNNKNSEDEWIDGREMSRVDFLQANISGWRISDEGEGYDATLKSIFYSSGKDSPDQIGKFGEGGKMSEILIKEKGFWVESRSAYNFTDEEGEHCVLWKSRPGKSPSGSMELHVTKVEMGEPIPTGSITEIRFVKGEVADYDKGSFIRCIKSEYDSQILFDAPQRFQSDFKYVDYDPSKPLIGMSTHLDGLMVQGVKVDPVNTEDKLAFGYSTFDKDALDARDRNKYSKELLDSVADYWCHANKEMLEDLINRIESSSGGDQRGEYFFETKTLNGIIQHKFDENGDVPVEVLENVRKLVMEIITERFDLEFAEKIYFVHGGESYEFMNDLKWEPITVVDTSKWGLYFYENTLVDHFGEKFISESEITEMFRKRKRDGRGEDLDIEDYRDASSWLSERYKKIIPLLNDLGIDTKDIHLPHTNFVRMGQLISSVEEDEEDEYSQGYSMGYKVLQINWEMAKKVENKDALDRLLAVYILARNDENFYIHQSQNIANEAIKNSWKNIADIDTLNLNYEVDINVLKNMIEGQREFETGLLAEYFETLERLSKAVIESSDLENIIELLNTNKSLVDTRYLEPLQNNIFKTSLGFARCVRGEDDRYQVESFGFDQMSELGEVEGKRIYRHDDHVFIELPSFDYVKFRDSVIYKHEDTLYRTNSEKAIVWEIETSGGKLKFGDKFCYFEAWGGYTDQNLLESAQNYLSELKIVDRNSQGLFETKLEDGHVATSISLEYGKGNWDNPVRLFEDVVQNHLNAGNVEIRYSVLRDGENTWVLANGLHSDDTINGIEFVDDGKGYSPESLERMGKSEKDSPLDEGKYGEGTKMLLAAASRNQISLEFSSVCKRGENRVNWRAKAGESLIGVIEKGRKSTVSLAGFDLESEKNQNVQGSKTKIMFNELNGEFYENCIKAIDPRLETKGLAKYARNLEGGVEVVSAVGPIKVLGDSKGDIFENGLFVTTKSVLLGSLDVPDVCATRERNEIKEDKLQQYVDFLMSHTTDENLIRSVYEKFITSNQYNYIDIRNLFDKFDSTPTNIGIWRKVVEESFSDVIIDDNNTRDDAMTYLQYVGYTRKVWIHGKSGKSTVLKETLPTIKELIKQNQLNPIDVSDEVREKVEGVSDSLADQLLEVIDNGGLAEATNREFIEILRNKEKLHSLIEYSRIHPFVLGQAKGDLTTIVSEYLLHDPEELAMVLLHEWAHHLTLKGDLDPTFVACLLGIGMGAKSV